MNKWLFNVRLLAAVAALAFSSVVRADDDFGCSNATLKRLYAFGVTNYTPQGEPNGPPSVTTGTKVFDGHGNFTQRDYKGGASPAQFAPKGQETGTYHVNSDCTGNMELDLNVPGSPAGTGIISILFVISDGGRHVHEVVSKSVPPFSPFQDSIKGCGTHPT
jgi:hypothetical protein